MSKIIYNQRQGNFHVNLTYNQDTNKYYCTIDSIDKGVYELFASFDGHDEIMEMSHDPIMEDAIKEMKKHKKTINKKAKEETNKELSIKSSELGISGHGMKVYYPIRMSVELLAKLKGLNTNITQFINMAIMEKMEKEQE